MSLTLELQKYLMTIQRMVNTSQRLDWGEYVAKMLWEVAEQQIEGDIKYKVVERGGKLLEKMLTNINPTKSDNCSETDCVVCASPGGGWLCHKTRIAYKIQCNNCDAVYIEGLRHNQAPAGKAQRTHCPDRPMRHLRHETCQPMQFFQFYGKVDQRYMCYDLSC